MTVEKAGDVRHTMPASAYLSPCQAASPPYFWVDSTDDFATMAAALAHAPRMAIDTEADSLYHYVQKVCLLQISTDSTTYIVDPLAVTDLSLLQPMMADSAVEKVFHAAGSDIAGLRRDHTLSFSGVFDTHIAAQLVGLPAVGLSALLEQEFDIVHSKRRQRDDWSQRPLNPEQLRYAAMDTHHLLALRDALEQRLQAKGRLTWAQEEFDIIAFSREEERVFDPQCFRRIKGSRDLAPLQQAMLQALFVLRDRLARQMDVPPFRVMSDWVLVDLVRHPPRATTELAGRRGVSPRLARNHGALVLQVLKHASHGNPVSPAPRPKGTRPPVEARIRLENLKRWRDGKAAELKLPVGIVFPNSQLEAMSLAAPADRAALGAIPGMRRWRVREFGEEALRALRLSS